MFEMVAMISSATPDIFNLERFLSAQKDSYAGAIQELRSGQKRSHWMWYIFPQLYGLGSSATARHYAIKSLEEARAYLTHPTLGARLVECSAIVNRLQGRSALQIFGTPDHMKFCSCMTLFELAADGSQVEFTLALEKYCSGRDQLTLKLLQTATL